MARHIAQPGVPIENVFKQVRINVLDQTAGRQTPWDSSSLVEDFFFVPAAFEPGNTATPEPVDALQNADPAAAAPVKSTEAPPTSVAAESGGGGDAVEDLLWQQVLASGDLEKLEAFLRLYPRSDYRDEATALATILAPEGARSAGVDAPGDGDAAGTEMAALSPDAASDVPAESEAVPPQEITLEKAEEIEIALELSRSDRREIQRRLTLLGFNTKGVDGIFGDGTRGAISSWQEKNDQQATGFLSEEEIDRLEEQSASKYAAYLKKQRASGSSVRTRGGSRYIDTRGCLRESDGRHVAFFKPGCG